MMHTWLGTRVDLRAARRDLVLAGVFTSLISLAATERLAFAVYGLVNGMMLGYVLHIVPPEPAEGDRRRGRIVVRGLSGACAGALLAPALRWLTSGAAVSVAQAPHVSELIRAAILGLIAGFVWYFAWGVWETRPTRTHRDA